MRCKICDSNLSDKEISFNELHQEFDPCFTCLTEIYKINNKFKEKLDEGNIEFADLEVTEEPLDAVLSELGINLNQTGATVPGLWE